MPMHDWTRVDSGIFHDFHNAWIFQLKQVLNHGLLPADYYALSEQHLVSFIPDVLTLRGPGRGVTSPAGPTALTQTRPKTKHHAESADAFYRRKQNSIAIRHASDDELVALIEIVSPGNKNNKVHFEDFLRKAWALLDKRIHLLILDPIPPGPRDPQGIHPAIWRDEDSSYQLPADQPLTFASYECHEGNTEAFVENLAVGEPLPPMPLFLEPGGHILVPLEKTYQAAWDTVPRRWQNVIEPTK